jgi:hypothetical protein
VVLSRHTVLVETLTLADFKQANSPIREGSHIARNHRQPLEAVGHLYEQPPGPTAQETEC